MKLPKMIFVGPSDYTVRTKKRLSDVSLRMGETDTHDSEILVKEKTSDNARRATLVHEVMHAIFFESGFQATFEINPEEEERMVSILSPWVQAVILDNPDLMKYLTEKDDK